MIDAFAEHRALLFTVAYEILGSAADAEDVLQESYLRSSQAADVRDPKAYLVAVVTRQSLNHLRSARRRREQYVGAWLPEPIQTSPDASHDAVLAESVGYAMLLVLETLSPTERAVFVLGEVFGYRHPEIADMLDKTPMAVRQIAHRAREHVQARRKRFESGQSSEEVIARFLMAAQGGDLQGLMDVMSPGVVAISDGGAKARAARQPIVGAEKVARFVAGVSRTGGRGVEYFVGTYNALPAVVARRDGVVEVVLLLEIIGQQITGLYFMLNPDKLGEVGVERPIAR